MHRREKYHFLVQVVSLRCQVIRGLPEILFLLNYLFFKKFI